ncbi:hypothetical protein EFK50_10070 [Nocardioides marmoriginsengisoli]|uniref:Carotenoid biosynthesis protein n=1 Tax=Nocardioides marmoriginsengisoli TaxID=661483 RepID=A0A3N0CFA6_9ACTN|nr:hypothetical protein [Nocardioides marmoriginsengisoli]RNL62140.1 hypothetical protein EFK50_10070 [Nocardioides marmoriginsengisoli]
MLALITALGLDPDRLTGATREALSQLRDPSNLHWYVVTFLGIVMYVYANEVERKRFDIVAAGLAFFLMDVFNELVNSAWLHASGKAPLWAVTGDTAYLILVGWSIEIVFLFLISGVEFVKFLPADKERRLLGLPNRWVYIAWWSCFCVFVEVLLHRAGIFHWSWWYWNEPFLLPIVVLGYGTFFWIAATVFDMSSNRRRFTVVGAMLAVDVVLAIVLGSVGWL